MSLTAVNLATRGECEVRFEHKDAAGRTLASEALRVAPGTFASLEFHPPDPIILPDPIEPPRDDQSPARLQVRGVVTPLTPRCELATTLEIFDNADGKKIAAIGDLAIIEDG